MNAPRHSRTDVHAGVDSDLVPRTIVSLVDLSAESEAALPVVRELADALDAEVVLVATVPRPEGLPDLRNRVATVAARAGDRLVAECAVAASDPAEPLARVARSFDRPIVCLASGPTGLSTNPQLEPIVTKLAAADRPVVLVGTNAVLGPAGAGVVACLDGTVGSERILPVAVAWARAMSEPLVVLAVAAGEGPRGAWLRGVGNVADYLHRVERTLHAADLTIRKEVVVCEDGPAVGALSHVVSCGARLVMLTAHGRSLGPLAGGSTTAGILRSAPVPLVVMHRASSVEDELASGLPHPRGLRFITPSAADLIARSATAELMEEQQRLRHIVELLEQEFDETESGALGELADTDQHPADTATETYEREKDLSLLNEFRVRLELIEAELVAREPSRSF